MTKLPSKNNNMEWTNDIVTEMQTGERDTVDPNIEVDEDGEPVISDEWDDKAE
jgi:hypothetical protein